MILAALSTGGGSQFEAGFRNRPVLVEVSTEAGHHLVLAGKQARHRILIADHKDCRGYIVRADRAMPFALAALSAFHEDRCSPRAAAARAILKPSAYHRHRLALLLAILDRFEQSASGAVRTRQIASEVVFPGWAFGRAIDWKSSSHRRQTQRLVAEARRMMATGYRDLLWGCVRPRPIVDCELGDADGKPGGEPQPV